jgi:hypothetical protein
MQKAHLYEAILLVNRGIDDAVRGLERLKRAKDSGLTTAYIDEKLTLFEMHRAHEKRMLDEVKVYQDVHAIEEIRRTEGKAPRVRFLSSQEQQAWERQYPKPPIDLRDEEQHRKGEQG